MSTAYNPSKAVHRTRSRSTCYRIDSLYIALQASVADLLRCILLSRASNRCEAALKKHRSYIGPRCVIRRVLEFPCMGTISPSANCKYRYESIRTTFESRAINACGYLVGLVYGWVEPYHNADFVVKVKNCHSISFLSLSKG